MRVIHADSEWEIISTFPSISNGTAEYLLKRLVDGLITVKHSNKCQVIDTGAGLFLEKTGDKNEQRN